MGERADVVVVGGGPVGLTLATELGLRDIDTLVVEAETAVVDKPKAGTLHARTVQSLARRRFLRVSAHHPVDAMVSETFHFAGMWHLPIAAPANEGVPIVGLGQGDLERLLERRARSSGVRVQRGHRVRSVDQADGAACATVAGPTGTYGVEARYLVGADGARSVVRRCAGMDAVTHPATVAALLGKVRLLDPMRTPAGWHRTERGWLVVNRNPLGHRRVITFDFYGPHADPAWQATSCSTPITTNVIPSPNA